MTRHAHTLDEMPSDREGARRWLDALPFSTFDALCVSAITSLIAEGDIGAGDVASFLSCCRDRYRAELKHRLNRGIVFRNVNQRGRRNNFARLNELQVRTLIRLRDMPNRPYGIASHAARCFNVAPSTVCEIWRGRNWRVV